MQRCCTTSILTLTSYRDLYSGGPALREGSITVHGCHGQVVLLHHLLRVTAICISPVELLMKKLLEGGEEGERKEGAGGEERKKLMKHEQGRI